MGFSGGKDPLAEVTSVNPVKRVEKLRSEYERALARSEARGAAYHHAVLGLLDGGGPELRTLAEELGLVNQPAWRGHLPEQTLITNPSRPLRRRRGRTAAALAAAVLILAALTLGALRVAHVPPFVPSVRVPRVLGMQEATAVRRLEDAGLSVRLIRYRRVIPGVAPRSVVGVSHPPAAGQLVDKGSTITLYVVEGRTSGK
jgi:PASTA domain-containing protein